MINKKFLLPVVFFFFLVSGYVSASHLMGGEITWKCQGNGTYIFQMKLYRDCNGASGPLNATINTDAPGHSAGINLTLDSQTDNSPVCAASGPHITCAGATGTTAGAVEEFVYSSHAPVTLVGVPPANGWTFWYSNCCRNAAIQNLATPQTSFTLHAKMYPYNGRNTNPCYDSSPRFYEIPRTVICTGYPFVFNHNAVDDELDSLVYDWDHPLDNNTSPTVFNAPNIPFSAPYTFNSPLPGPAQNPNNVAIHLDSQSGEVGYTSFTTGTYVFVIKVTAYKCGQKVAEIFRDIQVVLGTCAEIQPGFPNNPPLLTPPFIDAATGLQTSYTDTVYAGQNVHFIFNGQDLDADAAFNFQHLNLTASGLEFDPTFSNPFGACLHPPCATLSPSPLTYSPQINYAITFDWNTSCDQLGFNTNCRTFSNVYHFVFKFTDDFCPIPGISTATVTIVLLPPPVAAPPDLRCAAVLPNGDVSISWEPGADTAGTFKGYAIYYSPTLAGPFTFIDSVNSFAQTSYTHVGANADNQKAFYYIRIRSGCNDYAIGADLSDTIQAIKLTAANSLTGFAHLSWNSTHDPLIPTNSGYYYIYRELPPGTWTFIDSVDAFPGTVTYDDPITICNDTVKYRVEITDASGCISVSSIASDVFQDLIPPSIPPIDSVSVDANGLAIAGWQPDSSADTYAYVIFTKVGNAWTPIDTVYGVNNVFYTSTLDASIQSVPIRILAIDSCGNPSAMCVPQNTVYLTALLDVCSSSIALDWNAYTNWPGTVTYNVYASENNGPAVLLDTTTQTSYLHTSLNQNSTYCYFVRAKDATTFARTSTSNKVCVVAHILAKPNFSYIHTATITGDNQATIKVYVDTMAAVLSYKVLRSDVRSGFSQIASIPAYPRSEYISYTDYTAKTSERSYFYKVVAVDSCGQDVFSSDLARTIYITATPNDDISNTLEWNDYEVWLGGVDHYLLYRSVDGVSDGVINNVAFGSGRVIDDVSTRIYSTGSFCYYVEAYEGTGNMFGFSDTSRSNEVCVLQKPIVFVPNAFHPGIAGSFNNEFNPFKSFTSGESFNIDIFNRWGEVVFHNTDPKKGWDGSYKGTASPDGVYVYFFKVTGTDGTDIEKKGTLTLIR